MNIRGSEKSCSVEKFGIKNHCCAVTIVQRRLFVLRSVACLLLGLVPSEMRGWPHRCTDCG